MISPGNILPHGELSKLTVEDSQSETTKIEVSRSVVDVHLHGGNRITILRRPKAHLSCE
jgi:hypothetical protein